MKTIMVLGAGEAQVPIIKECKKLNLNTIIVDYDKNALGFKYADIKLFISTISKDEILSAAKSCGIDGIITTSDYPVRVVAYICTKLGLNGLSEEAAKISTNKFLLRECLHNNDIFSPKYIKVSSIEELQKLDKNINFPLIVKPVDSSASRGVRKVENKSELQSAFYEAKEYSNCGDVIIEEYINGSEYSVETLTIKRESYIIAVTEKKTQGANDTYFVEDRHIIPANITMDEKKQITAMVLKAINAVGLDNCASHTELKLTNKGPVIIEIGARLGGDYISADLVPLATGINMLENVINISIGHKINIKTTKMNYAGIQFINSKNYHYVEKHLKMIKSSNGYVRSELNEYRENDLKNSLDRLGYYICVSNTRQELEKLLNY